MVDATADSADCDFLRGHISLNLTVIPHTIVVQPAPSLADAIIYADKQSRLQYTTRVPVLERPFTSDYRILDVTRHHFLLEVPTPESIEPEATSTTETKNEAESSIENQQ
jgi:hypothetical protein